MGRCYSELGRRDEAIANLDEAVVLDRENARYALALGRELLSDSQNQRAHSVFGGLSADALDASERRAYELLRVRAAIESGHREEAVEMARLLVESDPNRASNHRTLGAALDAAGPPRRSGFPSWPRRSSWIPATRAARVAAIRRAASLAKGSESGGERQRHYRVAAAIAESLAGQAPDPEHSILAGEMWLGARAPGEGTAVVSNAPATPGPGMPSHSTTWGAVWPRQAEMMRRWLVSVRPSIWGPEDETLVRIHALLGSLRTGRMELGGGSQAL